MKISIDNPQAIWQIGRRDNQEDAIYPPSGQATAGDRLFILCDGMGGHEHGEVASNTVCTSMAEYLHTHADTSAIVDDSVLLGALDAAYKRLDKADDDSTRKMGTTLCLLLFHRGGLTAMHVGDSRIYHIRPASDRVIYQSRDHSMVYDLYQAGEISFEEMRTSPRKNIITRALQPGEDNRVRPAIVHISDIRPGDYFYICSDGMLEQMENDELRSLLSSDKDDGEKRDELLKRTRDNKDNHSAYLVRIKGVALEEGDDRLANDEQTTPDNAINIVPRTLGTQGGDVDVIAAPPDAIAQRHGSTRPRKDTRLPFIIGGVVVLLLLVVFTLVSLNRKHGGGDDAPTEQPAKTTRQGVITRPGIKEDTRAWKVNMEQDPKPKAGEKQQVKKKEEEKKKENKETGPASATPQAPEAAQPAPAPPHNAGTHNPQAPSGKEPATPKTPTANE